MLDGVVVEMATWTVIANNITFRTLNHMKNRVVHLGSANKQKGLWMSVHTKPSLCHTFLLSLTQSMLGSMVSRATERHLSLTTVQNAEMEDIGLHLRCGNISAYSSRGTKQAWPQKNTEFNAKNLENAKKKPTVTGITKEQSFLDELCSF